MKKGLFLKFFLLIFAFSTLTQAKFKLDPVDSNSTRRVYGKVDYTFNTNSKIDEAEAKKSKEYYRFIEGNLYPKSSKTLITLLGVSITCSLLLPVNLLYKKYYLLASAYLATTTWCTWQYWEKIESFIKKTIKQSIPDPISITDNGKKSSLDDFLNSTWLENNHKNALIIVRDTQQKLWYVTEQSEGPIQRHQVSFLKK